MKNIRDETYLKNKQPITLYQDNMSAIALVNENTKKKRSKHILTKISMIKDFVINGRIKIEYTNTKEMC